MVRRATLGAIVLTLLPTSASAETFTAACAGTTGNAASLVAAIDSANANGAAADAVALGPGCVYTLTAVENYWYGPNGLPAIASDITIQGNGATIARADMGAATSASSSSAPTRFPRATSRPVLEGSRFAS